MKPDAWLTVTSLTMVLLVSFHLSNDIVLGIEPGGSSNYNGILIMAVALCATAMLAHRRWAHVIVLLSSIAAAAVPWLHMQGVGLVGGRAANASGKFFWVWTLIALGVTGNVSAVLAARGLWRLRRGPAATGGASS